MSAGRRDDGGLPHVTQRLAALPGKEERLAGANESRDTTLRERKVMREVRHHGYRLRHSDYGYTLFDAGNKSVNGRNDMSLKEVESLVAAIGR